MSTSGRVVRRQRWRQRLPPEPPRATRTSSVRSPCGVPRRRGKERRRWLAERSSCPFLVRLQPLDQRLGSCGVTADSLLGPFADLRQRRLHPFLHLRDTLAEVRALAVQPLQPLLDCADLLLSSPDLAEDLVRLTAALRRLGQRGLGVCGVLRGVLACCLGIMLRLSDLFCKLAGLLQKVADASGLLQKRSQFRSSPLCCCGTGRQVVRLRRKIDHSHAALGHPVPPDDSMEAVHCIAEVLNVVAAPDDCLNRAHDAAERVAGSPVGRARGASSGGHSRSPRRGRLYTSGVSQSPSQTREVLGPGRVCGDRPVRLPACQSGHRSAGPGTP